MKKFVLILFLMLVSCGDKIPDGEYRLLDFKDEHFDPTDEYNIPIQNMLLSYKVNKIGEYNLPKAYLATNVLLII